MTEIEILKQHLNISKDYEQIILNNLSEHFQNYKIKQREDMQNQVLSMNALINTNFADVNIEEEEN